MSPRSKRRKRQVRPSVEFRPQDGPRARTIQLDDATMDLLAQQLAAFEAKFGRPAGPDDPMFFDPDADEPQPIPLAVAEREMARFLRTLGLSEPFVYANLKTGVLPFDENLDLLPPGDFDEFVAAYREVDATDHALAFDLTRLGDFARAMRSQAPSES